MKVQLRPKSRIGENMLIAAGNAMPRWRMEWAVMQTRRRGQDKPGQLDLFLVPVGQSLGNQRRFGCWVNKTADRDFSVHVLGE